MPQEIFKIDRPNSAQITYIILFLFVAFLMYARAVPLRRGRIRGDLVYSWTCGFQERLALQFFNLLVLLIVMIGSTMAKMQPTLLFLLALLAISSLFVPVKFQITKLGFAQNGRGFVSWSRVNRVAVRGIRVVIFDREIRKRYVLILRQSQKTQILNYLNRFVRRKR